MNVAAAYQRWGVTGRGTVVSILDDGIEKDHPDLVKNYVRSSLSVEGCLYLFSLYSLDIAMLVLLTSL